MMDEELTSLDLSYWSCMKCNSVMAFTMTKTDLNEEEMQQELNEISYSLLNSNQ